MITPLVLVVDDDPLIVSLLSHHLVAAGLGVITASDGRAAVEAVKRHRPTVAVFDVEMPELSGLQALRVIRTGKQSPPTIMLTSRRRPEHVVEGVLAGATDYLTKPFDPDDVLLKVLGLIEASRIAAAPRKAKLSRARLELVELKRTAA